MPVVQEVCSAGGRVAPKDADGPTLAIPNRGGYIGRQTGGLVREYGSSLWFISRRR